jgi:hypothetical protein
MVAQINELTIETDTKSIFSNEYEIRMNANAINEIMSKIGSIKASKTNDILSFNV